MAETTYAISSATIALTGQSVVPTGIVSYFAIASGTITLTGQTNGYWEPPVDPNPPNALNGVIFKCNQDHNPGNLGTGSGVSASVGHVTIQNTSVGTGAGVSAVPRMPIVISATVGVGSGVDAGSDSSLGTGVIISPPKSNWVEWSKIGDFNFIRDRSNEAGDRPMRWSGWAWRVLKLKDFAVVYGDNGICVMFPVEKPAATWGFKDIGDIGIKSPWSVCGTETIHYFISSNNELWRFTAEGPENLGFKEFLTTMTNPFLVLDKQEERLFISDGTTGYVFDSGLGGGYATLTGITKNWAISPDALTSVPMSIMTDVLDLGHRGLKTITWLEVGTYSTENIYAALDFRYVHDEAWRTSDWTLLNPQGAARITVSGVEFRVRLKQTVYDDLQIDYINIRVQRSDRRFMRGPIFEQGES